MTPVGIPRGALLAAASLVLVAREAAAQDLTESGDVAVLRAFHVPERCPDEASWVRDVLARVAPDAREHGRQQLPALVESVTVSTGGQRAALRLRGVAGERVVLGDDCGEVLAGAALIAAMALGSGGEPEPAAQKEGAPSAAPGQSEALESSDPLEPSGTEAGPPRARAYRADLGGVDRARRAPAWPSRQIPLEAEGLRTSIGAGAAAHTGLAPWPAALLDGAFELAWPRTGWSLRGRGAFGLARELVQGRGARFEYVGAGLDLCPLVFGAHLAWQWRSCVAFDLGRVHAAGEAQSALRTAERHRLWWSAFGLATRLQSPRVYGLRFELEGGAGAPLWRRRFEFDDPEAAVFETPALAVSARLGVQVPLE